MARLPPPVRCCRCCGSAEAADGDVDAAATCFYTYSPSKTGKQRPPVRRSPRSAAGAPTVASPLSGDRPSGSRAAEGRGPLYTMNLASQRSSRVELVAALFAAIGRGRRAPQDDQASVSLYLFASAALAVLDYLRGGQCCDPP